MSEPVKQVGATLNALMMNSGSVGTLFDVNPWPALAAAMQKVYLPIQQGLEERDQANYVVHLCTVYYAHQRKRVIWTDSHPAADVNKMKKSDLEDLIDFIEQFMARNGQWNYITKQDWYTTRQYVIGIDVNYYPDRSGFTAFLAFHKDTGGNNIFVNLVFDNTTDIEATEWYADIADPSDQRKAWQDQLLPDTYRKELTAARSALRDSLNGKERVVAGGVSKHLYTYVSWVDDLVWHSTPYGNLRTEFGLAAATRAYPLLEAEADDDFSYHDETLGLTILGAEILGTIAEVPDTELYLWLKRQDLRMPDLSYVRSKQAWQALYSGPEGKVRFLADAKIRALQPWRITGSYSEANAQDSRLADSEAVDEPPVLLSLLRRTNSSPNVQLELQKAREGNIGKPRAFIRTWVRVLSAQDPELAKIVFEEL